MGCQQAKPLPPPRSSLSARRNSARPASAGFVTPHEHVPAFPESEGPFFRSRPEDIRPIRFAPQGPFSQEAMPAETLIQIFARARAQHGSKPALKVERPVPILDGIGRTFPSLPDEEWKTWTWDEYWTDSRRVAKALLACQVARYEGVIVFGFNAPEWHLSQMGITMAGALTAGIYPTDSPDILAYKIVHCRARVAIVESSAKLRKLEEVLENIPRLTHIVGYDHRFKTRMTISRRDGTRVEVMPWADFVALGCDIPEERVDDLCQSIQPADCFAIFYTSGSSGFPRGVMLSHDNCIVEAHCSYKMVPEIAALRDQQERVLSYLPLSHCAAVMFDMITPMVCTAHRAGYFTTYFARTYDLKSNFIVDRLVLVRPTLFFGVPRVFEKLMDRVQAGETLLTMYERSNRAKAKRIGLQYLENFQVGRTSSAQFPSGFDWAETQVFLPMRMQIGLDEAKLVLTGGAPIQRAVVEFFAGTMAIRLMDSYGLTETSGCVLVALNNAYKLDSCGSQVLANEVCIMRRDGNGELCPPCKRLDAPTEEEQGELCFRGRTIMIGYLSCPESFDEQRILDKNMGAIDRLGWLHTGDKGCCDESGMYRITGRFKEVIISAGGASIAPAPIEDSIKRLSKGVVSNVLVIGDKRKFNVALITLRCKTNGKNGTEDDAELEGPAARLVPGVRFLSEARTSEGFIKHVEKFVNDTNFDGMVCPSRASQVKKFTILPHDFSQEEGDFSTSLKLRRARTEARYAKVIDAMYASNASVTYVPCAVDEQ